MAAIAFVGDSFCASYGYEDWKTRGCTINQYGTEQPTFVDLVAKRTGLMLHPYGFGGKSWWFSRQRFMEELERMPASIFADQLEVIVFCHTNSSRINNGWNRELSNTDTRSAEAMNFYRHIFDNEFNEWAQEQWFREINRRWGHLKTVHFHCFPGSSKHSNLLPGVVFNTPLIYISVGELTGTDADIHNQIVNDKRFNHLSDYNNQILADIISENLYNYCPGHKELDLSRFKIVNPNSINFPHGRHGTK